MRYKRIIDPIYKAEVHIVADCCHEDINIKLKRLYPDFKEAIEEDKEPCEAECFRLIHSNGFRDYVCWFKEFSPKKAGTLYAIVHEASHLVDKIFEDRGVNDDTEARAYYLEYLVREIWKFCGRKIT